MDIEEFKQGVKDLFRSSKATPGQWEEMAAAVLFVYETDQIGVESINETVEAAYNAKRDELKAMGWPATHGTPTR